MTLSGPLAARKRTTKLLTGCPGSTGSDSSNECLHTLARSAAGKEQEGSTCANTLNYSSGNTADPEQLRLELRVSILKNSFN